MQNNQVKKDVDVYSNVPDWLCTYSAWNNLVSGTLPTSSSKKRPYGQGEMLAFFTILFLHFLSHTTGETMILGGPGSPF